ncbi:MAG: Hpt domain-containing protein [Gammaproteobacteria bacterium]|nr:Hpt domain-containing protein [Gammaproteobacteria bacterium]
MNLDDIEQLPIFDEISTKSMRTFLGDEFNVIVDEFKTSTPALLVALKLAAENGRHEEIIDISHRLKSGSGNLGLSAFSTVCQYLEEGLRDGLELNIDQIINAIDNQFERIINS